MPREPERKDHEFRLTKIVHYFCCKNCEDYFYTEYYVKNGKLEKRIQKSNKDDCED